MIIDVKSTDEMKALGAAIGALLRGGEVVELIGDVGSGKTTLVKGIAAGLGIEEYVQSPSFTISRVYQAHDNLTLIHCDFYRLDNAGIMANALREVTNELKTITIIEWAGVVNNVLPADRLSIYINTLNEYSRKLTFKTGGKVSSDLVIRLNK
jgi:tRNA threonylcarbamoyladenosine biosynthesis protein TsaE